MKIIQLIVATVLFMVLPIFRSYGQVVYQHVSNTAVYEFLDEMANLKFIELNSAVKPYSRKVIAEKLMELNTRIMELSKRQKKELEFFIKEYRKEISTGKQIDYAGRNYFGKTKIAFKDRAKRPDLFYYRDESFMLSFNPVLGVQFLSNDSGQVYHRWNGAELLFYGGNSLGVYASLRDNYMSKAIAGPGYLTQTTGGGFKNPTYGFSNRNGVEYSEMRGGITYNGKNWNAGITKDHNVWGNNYHGSNIFSDRAPSFAQARLHVKPVSWFELNYFHGWLSSKVVDSAATQQYGTGTTTSYVAKYIAANFITIKPVLNLHVSIGNSIVYSHNFNIAYLIPVMFYKSLDHTYSTLGNSQMFIDLSVRNLRKCHFYATGYFDDFSFGRLFEKYNVTPWSFKAGGRVSNIVPNISVTAEYTRNYVFAYKHFNPETTFENTKYNMGHYLRDNAQEVFVQISYKPVPKLEIDISYTHANKGPDYADNRDQTDPVTGQPVLYLYSFQESIIWERSEFAMQFRYDVINDLVLKLRFEMSDTWDVNNSYTPEQFQGTQLTTSFTVAFGF